MDVGNDIKVLNPFDMENSTFLEDGKITSSKCLAREWYRIDVYMLPSKVTYFLQNAKDSCNMPYMILFLTSIGLDPAKAGQVNGLRYVGFIIGAPLWGMLADHKRIHRLDIFILCIFSIIFMCSQPVVSKLIGDPAFNRCPFNESLKETTKTNGMDSILKNQSSVTKSFDEKAFDTNTLYYIMLTLNIFAASFDGSIVGFTDSGVMQKIRKSPKNAEFGWQRLFGCAGFGLGPLLASMAIENFPRSNISCYSAVLCVYFILLLSLLVSTNILYRGYSCNRSNDDNNSDEKKVRQILVETLIRWRTIYFFTTILFVGVIHGVYLSFLFIFLKEELDANNLILWLSITCGAVSAIIVFPFSAWIIKHLRGTIPTMCLGCFSWFVRLLCFSFLQNPWLVLPLQFLQGIGFAMFIAASVHHIKLISSPIISTTMYGIMNSLFYGFGLIISNVAGGGLYQEYGPRKLFLGASFASLLWTIFMVVYLISDKVNSALPEPCESLTQDSKKMATA